jgi:4-amino-4-deoxy-L-arabinose transferase-like glycosyltransferase
MMKGQIKKLLRWFNLLVILTIFGGTLILEIPHYPRIEGLSSDSGVFAYYGQQILHGRLLYRDIWDHKPPGVYYLNAAVFILLGQSTWAIWWLNVAWIWGAASLLYLFLGRLTGRAPAALASLLFLMLVMFPDFYSGGNLTEVYALIPQILTIGILAAYLASRKQAWILGLGLATGAAFIFKPTYVVLGLVTGAAGLFFDLWQKTYRRALGSLLAYALGAAILPGIIALYWASQGAFQDMIFAVFTFNFQYSQQGFEWYKFENTLANFKDRQPLATILAFCAAALVIYLYQNWRRSRNPEQRPVPNAVVNPAWEAQRTWVFACVFLALPIEIIQVSISGRNFWHYYLTPLPVMVAACAYLFMELSQAIHGPFRKKAWVTLLLVGLTVAFFAQPISLMVEKEHLSRKSLAVFLKYGFNQTLQPNDLERYILEHTGPTQSVLVWSVNPGINFMTDRRSPTRYASILPLLLAAPETPARYQQFMDDLTADPPALILVQPQSSSHIPYFGNPDDLICTDECNPIVVSGLVGLKHYVKEQYKLTAQIFGWEIYRRLN